MPAGVILTQSNIAVTGLTPKAFIVPVGFGVSSSLGQPTLNSQVIFTEDFESGTLDPTKWQDIAPANAFAVVTTASQGIPSLSGANVMRVSNPGGAITHFVSTGATSPYTKLHLSYWLYRTSLYDAANPAGVRMGGIRGSTTQFGSFGVGFDTAGSCPFDPNNVHQQEFMFSYCEGDVNTYQLRLYTQWLDENPIRINPLTCGGNFAFASNGSPSAVYVNQGFVISNNTWHFFETEVQLNTVGLSDGYSKIWCDGTLLVHHDNVRYRSNSNMSLWGCTFDSGNVAGGLSASYYVDSVQVLA